MKQTLPYDIPQRQVQTVVDGDTILEVDLQMLGSIQGCCDLFLLGSNFWVLLKDWPDF